MQPKMTATISQQQFDAAITELITSNAPNCLATLGFIRSKIKQFHLDCDVFAVVNECYLRGAKLTETGQEIYRPLAWIRATAYNVIREMARQQKRIKADSPSLEMYLAETEIETTSEATQADWQLLKTAFAELRPDEQAVLKLRWLDELPWRDVAKALSQDGKQVELETVRKRGQRAFKRLRTVYEAMEKG